MAYSIEDAFSDGEIAMQSGDAGAIQRLESFMAELTEVYIKDNYLALSRLSWKLPFRESVQLAHVVIERYLSVNNLWSDIYLWGFSALRQVPVADTVWITRNYLAISLQALGQSQMAQDILRENWMSMQAGSGVAYELLTGTDLSESMVSSGHWKDVAKKEEELRNEFLELRATWLDIEKVEKIKKGFITSLSEDSQKSKVLRTFIDSNQDLTSFVLDMVDSYVAKRGVERDNTLFGFTLAIFAFLKLDDAEYLVEEAAKAEMRGDDPSVAIDYLSIAAFLMNPAAYVPLVKVLNRRGLVEQAIGYANVAVSKNIPGSADVLIFLLGLDGVRIEFNDVEMSETDKVSAYKLLGGNF